MQLDEVQSEVMQKIFSDLDSGRNIITLGGYAGTGKTTLIKHLITVLGGWSVAAFTGKAVLVLKKKGIPAQTIHQTIYKPNSEAPTSDEVDLSKPDESEITFSYNPKMIEPGFIIDESSMVTEQIFHDLRDMGKPIIFVGDHGQLPPVNANGGSDFNIMKTPDYRLEKLHRNAGPVAIFAEYLRNGGNPRTYKSNSDKVVITNGELIPDDDIVKSQAILCSTNKRVMEINKYVRRLRKYQHELMVGEKLMVLQNYHPYFFNGGSVVVDDIFYSTSEYHSILCSSADIDDKDKTEDDYHRVNINRYQFEHTKTINCPLYLRNRENNLYKNPNFVLPCQYGYAMTVHKSQGSEFDQVCVVDDIYARRFSPMHKNYTKWAYTAATRAKEKLFWINS